MGQDYNVVFIEQIGNAIRIIAKMGQTKRRQMMQNSWLGDKFVSAIEFQISPDGTYPNGQRVVWAGDWGKKERGMEVSLNGMCNDLNENLIVDFPEKDSSEYRYVVNHSKRLFVDKENTDEDKIHPLPLLTCEGWHPDRGGDYNGKDPQNIIGSWARDIVAVTREPPEGYLELYFDLTEWKGKFASTGIIINGRGTAEDESSDDEAIGDEDGDDGDEDD
jgi:hypothetical protein